MADTPETKYKKKIQKYLDSIGAYHVKILGGSGMRAGTPDILLCYEGHFIGLELKSEKGKPSELQLKHVKEIKEAGGTAFILYPKDFDDFKAYILTLKK